MLKFILVAKARWVERYDDQALTRVIEVQYPDQAIHAAYQWQKELNNTHLVSLYRVGESLDWREIGSYDLTQPKIPDEVKNVKFAPSGNYEL